MWDHRLNGGTKTSQMGKEKKKKRYDNRNKGEGREGDRERETALRLHPDQRECCWLYSWLQLYNATATACNAN